MRARIMLLCATVILASCGRDADVESVAMPAFNIDSTRITVSGISAGSYMAGQLHVAHSSIFRGAGLLAGGPYWCAAGSIKKGLGPCMNGGDVNPDELHTYARDQDAAGSIDSLANLADDAVWIFHGTHDTIVNKDVPIAAASFYEQFLPPENITVIADTEAPHGMPTIEIGAECDTVVSPFLNACDYDAAGEILRNLSGDLRARTTATGALLSIPQPGADDADMLDAALLYVPTSCNDGESCGIHVAFHGCQQSVEFIGDAFAAGAGYNEWAESNSLLVLYPQVASSKIAPLNPLGCWDWWGYTGDNYATQSGPQIAVVKATLDSLAGKTL